MKYYLLEKDPKLMEIPKLHNWYQKVDAQNLKPEKYHLISRDIVLFGSFSPNSVGNEIIVEPFLLLPSKGRKILSKFEPNMEYINMPVVDQAKNKIEHYVFPLLKDYDCLNAESVLNQDKSVIVRGILTKQDLPDQTIFLLRGVSGRRVVIRQDLAEGFLRRYLLGFCLKELEIKGE